MNFKQMTKYEPGLLELEQRMRAIINLITGYYAADFDDLEELIAAPCLLPRDELCLSRIEESFTRSLMALVGPSAMHPLLKDAELYSIAHASLWKRFPRCGTRCGCTGLSDRGWYTTETVS